MSPERLIVWAVVAFAVGSVLLNAVGPKILGGGHHPRRCDRGGDDWAGPSPAGRLVRLRQAIWRLRHSDPGTCESRAAASELHEVADACAAHGVPAVRVSDRWRHHCGPHRARCRGRASRRWLRCFARSARTCSRCRSLTERHRDVRRSLSRRRGQARRIGPDRSAVLPACRGVSGARAARADPAAASSPWCRPSSVTRMSLRTRHRSSIPRRTRGCSICCGPPERSDRWRC